MPPITARERVRRADPRCQLTIDISWLCQSDFHVPTMRGHLFASFNARAANIFRGLQGEDVIGLLQNGETVDSVTGSCLPTLTKSQAYECLAYYENHRGEIDLLVARQMSDAHEPR